MNTEYICTQNCTECSDCGNCVTNNPEAFAEKYNGECPVGSYPKWKPITDASEEI